jgi:hypothetical protein
MRRSTQANRRRGDASERVQVCITEQTMAVRLAIIRAIAARVPAVKTMFSTIAVLVAAGGALLLYKSRVAGRADPANLGWMSAQWLAEHRASHPS